MRTLIFFVSSCTCREQTSRRQLTFTNSGAVLLCGRIGRHGWRKGEREGDWMGQRGEVCCMGEEG